VLLVLLLLFWAFKLVTEMDKSLSVSVWLPGFTVTVAIMIILKRTNRRPSVLWNEPDAVLMLLGPWKVKACAARLMTSVPLGIDLSRSAWRVLQSMHPAMSDSSNGTLGFFVCRPLDQGPTRVGMMVMRTRYRLGNNGRRISELTEKVLNDVRTLESAMKAAYPHMPIEKAGLADVMTIVQGGVQSVAQPE